MAEKSKPELKILPTIETSDDPFDPRNLSLSVGEVSAGKRDLLKIPVRKPSKGEFFRSSADPTHSLATTLLVYEQEFFLVLPTMRYEVPEAAPYTLHLCVNRGGALFWWPIRLPAEDGKSNHWWESARRVENGARENWKRMFSDRGSNMYASITATIPLPEPTWPTRPVAELLRLGFAEQTIADHNATVLKILRGEI